MEVIAAAQSVQALLGQVVQLVMAIRQARDDVLNLPKSIEDLWKVVEQLNPVIDKIQAKVQDEEGLLKPHLEKLAAELSEALKKVRELKAKPPKQGTRGVIIAFFHQGSAKQQKEIKDICNAIERQRENLDKALGVDTRFKLEDTHLIVKSTQLTVKASASATERIESSIMNLHVKVDGNQTHNNVEPPAIIAHLDRWVIECLADESYHVDLLVYDSRSNEFVSPRLDSARQTLPLNDDDKDEEDETRRGARVGGWEVENSTKVQFQIRVQQDCFFYVLGFEKGLPFATNLELIFPEFAVCKNQIVSSRARKFPDPIKYKTDPQICKVEKHVSLRKGVPGQVLLYIVLSGEPLVQVGSVQVVDLDYIKEQVILKDDSEVLYVERFFFDVK